MSTAKLQLQHARPLDWAGTIARMMHIQIGQAADRMANRIVTLELQGKAFPLRLSKLSTGSSSPHSQLPASEIRESRLTLPEKGQGLSAHLSAVAETALRVRFSAS